MKRILLLLVFCIIACEPEGPSKPVIVDGGTSESGKPTRPRNKLSSRRDTTKVRSSVSIADISAFIQRECTPDRGFLPSDVTIEPFVKPKEQDTLMYIVNYPENKGWTILSADARTPAIIAYGESGCFDINAFDGAMEAWIGKIAEDMALVRHSPDCDLAFTENEIILNRAFWTGAYPSIVDSTRTGDRGGHWEVITTQEVIIDTTVNHFTPKWDQGYPYNQYCPYRVLELERAAAGCVAVAGAEVLYYLHGKFSVPEQMVSYGYCHGFTLTHGNNDHYFGNPNSDVWDDMDPSYSATGANRPEALMIGKIGHDVGMNYGNSSWALPENLRTNVFIPYGISCNFINSYNEYAVRNNLSHNNPVIITASNLVIPIDGHFHCFVADGYKIAYIKSTHFHHWVKDVPIFEPADPYLGNNPPSEPQSGYDSYYTYTYSLPYLYAMTINWGWSNQWTNLTNEGWFAFTAGWTVTNGSDVYDYNHNISMIYDFAVAN